MNNAIRTLVCSYNFQETDYVAVYLGVARPSWFGDCAAHTYFVCGSTLVPGAFFFYPGDDEMCTFFVSDNTGMDNLIKLSWHELVESVTDPRENAWYASGINEIADICNDLYTKVEMNDNTTWIVQPVWDAQQEFCSVGT